MGQAHSEYAAIQEVLANYALLLEEEDALDAWLQLFAEDARFHVFHQTLRGREEIGAMLSKAPHGIHLLGLPSITLDGDRPRSVTSYVFFTNGGVSEVNAGWYFDEFTRTSAGWKISDHRVMFCSEKRSQFRREAKTSN